MNIQKFFYIFFSAILFASCTVPQEKKEAERGVLDLSADNLSIPIKLEGEWEFYWNTLLDPADFEGPWKPEPIYRIIPSSWAKYSIDGISLPLYGNATYRLTVRTDGSKTRLGLRLKKIYSSYRIFINGEAIREVGSVEKDFRKSRGRLASETVFFISETPEIEIILQVSNPFYPRSGIMEGILLGEQEIIQRAQILALMRDMFSIGSVVFASVYFLILFFLRQKEKAYLFFSLFCWIVALRSSLVSGDRIFYDIFQNIDLIIADRWQSISLYTLLPAFITFIEALFPEDIHPTALRIFQYSGLVALGALFTLNPRYSELVLLFYYPFLISGIIYIIYIILLAIRRKKSGSLIEGIGFLFLGGTAVHDLLVDREIIFSDYWLEAGLIIFILFQSFILSKRFSQALEHEESLTAHLNKVRDDLEHIVDRRTKDLREINRQLEVSRKKAEEANRAKSTFLTNMSHEMRTPLNGIIGNAELLLDSADKGTGDYANRIINESSHLLFLINQLLDLARIEAGKMKLERQPFSLNDTMASIEYLLKPLAQKKSLTYETFISEDVPDTLTGDPERLRQIIINIAGNAVKFTKTGSVSVYVELFEKNRDNAVIVFRVSDTGIGMSRKLKNKVFDIFSQGDTSSTRTFGGTGLGTTIAKQLVDLMHGYIEVSSEEGKGSTFIITLPFDTPASSISQTSSEDKTVTMPILHNRSILLVEDYPTTQQIISQYLERAQASVTIVDNGPKALEAWNRGTYDLVLMDIQLPEMDGFEVTRQIRQSPKGRDIPIIAITANALSDVMNECSNIGISDVLVKPIRRTVLLRTAAKYLEVEISNSHYLHEINDPELPMDDFDDEMREVIVNGFIEQTREQLDRMDALIEREDFITLHRDAHAMKGGALNIQEEAIAEIAGYIEKSARSKDLNGIRHNLSVLRKAFDTFLSSQGK